MTLMRKRITKNYLWYFQFQFGKFANKNHSFLLKNYFQLLKFYQNNMSFKNTRIIRNILLVLSTEVSHLRNDALQDVALVRNPM